MKARWVGPAYDPRSDIGVFWFRLPLQFDAIPDILPIAISADQRYKLYVNDQHVGHGPQRGDTSHWFYESYNLAPYLKGGSNEIRALVWNFGRWAPLAQHSVRTAFWFQSDIKGLDTPGSWEVARITGWDFDMMHSQLGHFYIDVGPGEILDLPQLAIDPSPEAWRPVHDITWAERRGAPSGGSPWFLLPRSIPPMRYELRDVDPRIRRGFLGDNPLHIPEVNGRYSVAPGCPVLLDYGELLCAYPRISVLGKQNGELIVTYSEAMWASDGSKGHRDDVVGRVAQGYQDRWIADTESRTAETLWWRTFRYILLEATAPLQVNVEVIETGYPYHVASAFVADDPRVAPIWRVSVRTAQRCAGETYFDCPYYEQLQYIGDTRIQALLHNYLSEDRLLSRNATQTLGWSLMENGLTQSRYPCRQAQVIPTFSLIWILMLHDQVLYDGLEHLPDFVTPELLGNLLKGYCHLMERPLEEQFWQFGDWHPEWRWGIPPGGATSLQHRILWEIARHAAAELAGWMGDRGEHLPRYDQHRISQIGDHLFAKSQPSEHEWALWGYLIRSLGQIPAAPPDSLYPLCSYYFTFYRHEAYPPDNYLDALGPWHEMIEQGLTTFAETPGNPRSDCHAWSAHPALGFLRYVAGVVSDAPGWEHAVITPRPGSLRRFTADIAHPRGLLQVRYEEGALRISSPIPFALQWQDRSASFEPGSHRIDH